MFQFSKSTSNFTEKQIAAGVTAVFTCVSSNATEDEFGCINPNGGRKKLNITAFGAADEMAIEQTLAKAKGIVTFRGKRPFTKSGLKSFEVNQGPNAGTYVIAMISTKGDLHVDLEALDTQRLTALGISFPQTITEPSAL